MSKNNLPDRLSRARCRASRFGRQTAYVVKITARFAVCVCIYGRARFSPNPVCMQNRLGRGDVRSWKTFKNEILQDVYSISRRFVRVSSTVPRRNRLSERPYCYDLAARLKHVLFNNFVAIECINIFKNVM